jgi:Electron transfer DM13
VAVSSLAAPPARPRSPRLLGQLAAVPVVAVVVAAGVWVAGGVLADDFRGSLALTAAWFALSGAACAAVALRRPALRVPVLAAFVLTAGAIGGYLGLSTLRDRVVNETVVTGMPASALRASAAGGRDGGTAAAARAPAPTPASVELARGRFRSGEHATAGTAAVVRLRDGRRFLTLTRFATSPGPDLRVRLVPGGTLDGAAGGAVDLGALKGNRGDQQYRLPAGAAIAGRSVVIWCRAFSAPFGGARLRAS